MEKTISDYLDVNTTTIDSAISKHQQIIEKLEEYRKAVITQAVTKGLNPNAEMKDSGVDWIGDCNSEWQIMKLKHIIAKPLKYGANESGVSYSDDLPRYIRITDINDDGTLKDEGKQSLPYDEAEGYVLNDKTLLFARSGATVGKAFLYHKADGLAAFAGYLISAEPDTHKVLSEWIIYYTQSIPYQNWKAIIFNQATIQNIGADKYKELSMPVPSLEEQTQIIAWLDKKCTVITRLIEKHNQLISKLQEYKQSLIYNAVTGKIDCRTEVEA